MLEAVVAFVVAVGAFLSGGYAFGGTRRRRAILELFEIRQEVARDDHRDKIDDLIESELEALVQLGDTTRRWLKTGYTAGMLFLILTGAACVAAFFVVGVEARIVVRYVAASLCVAGAGTLALTMQGHWEAAVTNRWSRLSPIIFAGTFTAGAVIASILKIGRAHV